MVRILSKISRFLSSSHEPAPAGEVARQLLERAEARAGRDPQQAQELRSAARAYLSVIR
jgi:hypothetical protein